MTQQTSPFLEGKYGWSLGESGWNFGMDENLLKFSFLFDKNINGIVSSLPVAVNGDSYFLTTDNRLYFAVGSTYYSSPTPKWFEVTIKGSGDKWLFNGTSMTQIGTATQLQNNITAAISTANAYTDSEKAEMFVELASTTGASSIGTSLGTTVQQFINTTLAAITDFTNKFSWFVRYETPEAYGYTSGGTLAARTAAVQAAFDAANTNKRDVVLSGTYLVSKILLSSHTEYNIRGTGVVVGVDTNPQSAVLEIRNCTGIKSSGNITISANGLTNYASAIKVWGTGGVSPNLTTCSLHSLNFNVVGASIGWQFGDLTAPDNLLSEIVITCGYSYNTPQVVSVIGTQAVIEFNGYQLISNGTGSLAGSFHIIANCVGGKLHINGGECQMPLVNSGYGFVSTPINSPAFAHTYGRIYVNGSAIECASLIFLAYNPNSVPSVAAGSGCFKLTQCSGYHSFSGVSFQGVADFSGQVVVDDTNNFYANAVRSADTANFAGAADVKLSELAFDSNFKRGIYGIVGGVARFDFQQILQATNLNSQAITSGASSALKFSSVAATPINTRFSSAYNTTTGIFTVPAGGLKSVELSFCVSSAARPASEINVLIDGSFPVALIVHNSKYICASAPCGDLTAGQTIQVRYTNADAGTQTFGANIFDRMTIRARN